LVAERMGLLKIKEKVEVHHIMHVS